MKYFSEVTKKVYDTVEALETAEAAVNTAHEAQVAAEKRVEAAMAAARKARKAADAELKDYCEKYGTYKAADCAADNVKWFFDFFE